jgi:hypothetical protein
MRFVQILTRTSGSPSAAVRKMDATSPMLELIMYLKHNGRHTSRSNRCRVAVACLGAATPMAVRAECA